MPEDILPDTTPPEEIEQSHATRVVALVVGLVLMALIGLLAFGGGGTDSDSSRLLGKRVPQIAGLTMAGDDYDIDDSRGRWVLVNFFATWCPPCVAEHPDLVALQAWGEETDQLDLVAVVFNDTAPNVAEFFEKRGGSWPVLDATQPALDFQIQAVPETFLVDPFGVVQVHFTGGISADEVIAIIEGAG